MQVVKVSRMLGLAAIGALLVLGGAGVRAQAMSLSNPGAAAAVQEDIKADATEVRWGRHRGWHRGHHRHHRHHHRHWRRW